MITGFFTNHNRRTIQVAIGDLRKNAAVSHTQSLYADHPVFWINHGQWIIRTAHFAGSARMISAFHMLFNERIQLFFCLNLRPWLNFMFHIGLKSFLRKNLTGQFYCRAKIRPVLFVRHIVEQNFRRLSRIARPQSDRASRWATHGADMSLKPMAFSRSLSIIAHGNGQKVILQIGVIDPSRRSDERRTFKLI